MPKRHTLEREYLRTLIQSKIKIEGECWVWAAGCDTKGYGYQRINGTLYRVSRLSHYAFNEAFDLTNRDVQICHRCDNPPCCNPNHLFIGNVKINNQDKAEKGRVPNASLTSEQVLQVKEMIARGLDNHVIMQRTGIPRSNIKEIRSGRVYKHIILLSDGEVLDTRTVEPYVTQPQPKQIRRRRHDSGLA